MAQILGSFTSGHDGSSEGGRINTNHVTRSIVLQAVPLIERLRAEGYTGKVEAVPVQVDGVWCLKLIFPGPAPAGIPERWQGRRVVVEAAAG